MDNFASNLMDQAMGELLHQWEPTNVSGNRQLQYKGLGELCQYLESCGIAVGDEARYSLLLTLRSSDFKETLQDNEVKFLMWE